MRIYSAMERLLGVRRVEACSCLAFIRRAFSRVIFMLISVKYSRSRCCMVVAWMILTVYRHAGGKICIYPGFYKNEIDCID